MRSNMSVQKKQIILNEIAFWKQNKLLPEHYCDFLTNLYVQGDGTENQEQRANDSLLIKKNRRDTYLLIGLAILSICLITVLIISANFIVPMIISLITILIFVFFAWKLRLNSTIIRPILLVLSALLLLAISFKGWELYFQENSYILLVFLLINCLLWLVTGIFQKLIYFTISGVLGIIVILIYFFVYYI